MLQKGNITGNSYEKWYLPLSLIALALTVFVITWVSIKESRSDSFKLMVMQGTAFIEALTQAADNAITSESFFDFLVHKRFSEIVVQLTQDNVDSITERQLVQLAVSHNLYGIFIYNKDSSLVVEGVNRGSILKPPDYVYNEICQLIANPEDNYLLLLDEGNNPDEKVHFYIEITNQLDRVILLVADALFYVEALKQTQIGYLAQKMAREKGVEYIIYQSTEGIIFASRKTGNLLAIESDSFLLEALDSDTVMSRNYIFQDKKVLELVRPFTTDVYPYGLLRVGFSLDRYNAMLRGYDFQMITIAAVLFSLILVVLLYLNSRRKRKQIDRQYQQIKSITDKIFEEMRTGVVAVDGNGYIILANDAFNRIFHLKDPVGNSWNDIINKPELFFETVTSRREKSFERELIFDFNSSRKYLLIIVSKMLPEKNEATGLVAVIYDITQLKELEKKSARKERLSEMGNLAAGVAHEIRNPLNTISIAAQRLAAEFSPSENREEYLSFTKQIQSETKRLNSIINRFLTLTRKDKERRRKINLTDLINEFVQLVKYEAEQLRIELLINAEPRLEIEGDPDSMKQVFSNLYNNAKEALNNNPGKIEIIARKTGSSIQIQFTDSGSGIAKDIREQVFAPYYTTKKAGTGLGLPTVYKIITDMGGDIKIEDSRFGGANFIITFPV
ncbi:MAG: nitrogen regulation protein NR(II) [Candidatus Zixiibacteriota bacterium]